MFQKTVNGRPFVYPNEVEFHLLYEEVFKKHVYYVQLEKTDPVILDVGAHIGLATIYFRSLYMDAKITAFEPHPQLLDCLQKNLAANIIKDVTVIPKAVWTTEGRIKLHVDTDQENQWLSTSSLIRGSWTKKQPTTSIDVEAVRLSTYMDGPIDILKMDVEGAEYEVLKECLPKLAQVQHLFVEVHTSREHGVAEVVTLLLNAGFQVSVYHEGEEISINDLPIHFPRLYLVEGHR